MAKARLKSYGKTPLIKDLAIGVKFIVIPKSLLGQEREKYFEVHEVRKRLPQVETQDQYLEYKNVIKGFVRKKELFIKN